MPGKAAKVIITERQQSVLQTLVFSRSCPQGWPIEPRNRTATSESVRCFPSNNLGFFFIPDNNAAGTVARKSCSSDMTDEQRAILEPFLKPNSGPGRRNRHPLCKVVNAVFYINANGCK